MVRGLKTLLVAGLLGLAPAAVGCTPPALLSPAAASAVVRLVNAERAAHGLAPLAPEPRLSAAAGRYAEDMASRGFFSHTGSDGSAHTQRVAAAGYEWAFTGENLAAGQPTPERVVDQWMKSPTHRANVLAPEATEVGVGRAYGPSSLYGHYWAMEIGAPR